LFEVQILPGRSGVLRIAKSHPCVHTCALW